MQEETFDHVAEPAVRPLTVETLPAVVMENDLVTKRHAVAMPLRRGLLCKQSEGLGG